MQLPYFYHDGYRAMGQLRDYCRPRYELGFESATWLILAGVAMGSGYALWNYAIIGGNMVLLATLSYFTPVLSTVISSFILGLVLTDTFLQGVVLVTLLLFCFAGGLHASRKRLGLRKGKF